MMSEITVNGESRPLEDDLSLEELIGREVEEDTESLAVAVNDEVIPRSDWGSARVRPGDQVELIRPIQGGDRSFKPPDEDPLEIAGRRFESRLFVGTGGHTNLEKMRRALVASETEMVTVGLRRVGVNQSGRAGMMDVLGELDVHLLPNTAGCYTADDAVKTARLGRESLDTNWVKLEVIGDDETLYPDVVELLEAARRLVEDDFIVLPYTNDDPVTARKLVSIGCPVVMPLGSPIGSGRGLANPQNLTIIREELDVPIVVDAGIGSAQDAAQAMELGADAILTSSAIARAEDPPLMAAALRDAVRAGRRSYRAGRIPRKLYARESTTMEGRIRGT